MSVDTLAPAAPELVTSEFVSQRTLADDALLDGTQHDRTQQDGEQDAPRDPATQAERHRLVEEHVALADHIARRLCPPTVSREDFIQVARLALVQAADRFDPSRGVPFAGYAGVVVSGRLKHYLRDSCWDVRVPRSLQETWLRAGKARDALSQRLGRSPSVAELAAELGVDEEHLLASMPVGESWTVTRFESLAPDGEAAWEPTDSGDAYTAVDDHLWLRSAIPTLPDRLRDIVRMYYVEEVPQRVIAERIGVSQMQVSRLLAKAISMLRAQAPA